MGAGWDANRAGTSCKLSCYSTSSSFRLLTAASNVRWPQLTRGSLEAFVVWCRVCAVVRVLCVTR